jgi:hypothetical protein
MVQFYIIVKRKNGHGTPWPYEITLFQIYGAQNTFPGGGEGGAEGDG